MKKLALILMVFVMIISLSASACSRTTSDSISTTTQASGNNTTTTAMTVVPTKTTASQQTTSAPSQKTDAPPLTTSVKANWWDTLGTPKYGGEITAAVDIPPATDWDPANPMGSMGHYIFDSLFFYDWSADPSIHPLKGEFVTADYYKGFLADTWEQLDPLTVNVHLKKGIHWQNKPPVNGREFISDDVKFNFDRLLGIGSGFTESNPLYGGLFPDIAQVNVIDKYTIQFKLKQSTIWSLYQVLASGIMGSILPIGAPEVIKKGNLNDKSAAVGTGPWMLDEYIPGASLTYVRNPDYWGYDERHPQNQLPYADSFKVLAIPDMTTKMAAMRTGKIDIIADQMSYPSWQQVAGLKKTNPDIKDSTWPLEGYGIDLRCDHAPFDDIKVRKALQLAVDRKLIAQIHYGGTVDGTPCGLTNPIDSDWYTPFNQWPADLQAQYIYNKNEAKALLAETAYPDGFDVTCLAHTSQDMALLEIIKAQFLEIGVDMTIQPFDVMTFMNMCMSGKNEQMAFFSANSMTWGPLNNMGFRTNYERRNFTHNNDATFEAMYKEISSAATIAEAQGLVKKADQYALSQHWSINLFPLSAPLVWQPWLKGYNGERVFGEGNPWYARMWVDKASK